MIKVLAQTEQKNFVLTNNLLASISSQYSKYLLLGLE